MTLSAAQTTVLVQQAKDGDLASLGPVYERLVGPLVAWLHARVRERQRTFEIDPDDFVGEVWCRAMTNIQSFEATYGGDGIADRFRRWVFGIARHTLQEALRAGQRRGTIPLDTIELPESVTSSLNRMIRSESAAELKRRIDGLSAADKRIIWMRVEGRSHAEIAASVAKGEGAVRQRYSILRAELRDWLAADWEDDQP